MNNIIGTSKTRNFEYQAIITNQDGVGIAGYKGVDLHTVLTEARKYVKFPVNGNRVRTYLIQYNSQSWQVTGKHNDDVLRLIISVVRW